MTALSDLRLAAQQRCDRVNATTITNAEWNSMINYSAGRLYRLLVTTYEDYNVTTGTFTLVGGVGGNTVTVGPGSAFPLFDKLRKLGRQVGTTGSGPYYAPVLKLDSLIERDTYAAPPINPIYGNVAVRYVWTGATIELLPPDSAAGTYLMYYVPIFVKLVNDTDTIDGSWMALNGIDEYIIVDVAAKALIKEESLDTAQLLIAEREELRADILRSLANRDDNQPGRIADVKRVRSRYGAGGGWGGPWP